MAGRRKINTDELLELRRKGMGLKELAKHFGVSSVGIWKQLKKLKMGIAMTVRPPIALPASFEKLNERQQQFVLNRVEGMSGAEAVISAGYDVTSKESAKSTAKKLMRNPAIKNAFVDLMNELGIGREDRIKRLADHVHSPDQVVSLKALDLSFKLDGYSKGEETNKKPIIYISYEKLLILNQVEKLIK